MPAFLPIRCHGCPPSNSLLKSYSQIANPSNGPAFGGKLYEEHVAYYLDLRTRQETTSIEPTKIVESGKCRIAGGGTTYFDAENEESADTFLQSMQRWIENPQFEELLRAKQTAIKDFYEKRDKLDTELTKLTYKTRLKGNCEFTKP